MKKFVLSIYAAVTVALLAWGFYQAIYVAPDEQTMHEAQRIFYYHVPSAMVAFLFFAVNLCASIWFLWATLRKPEGMEGIERWMFWIVFFFVSGRFTASLFNVFRKEKKKSVPFNRWFFNTAQAADACPGHTALWL